MREKESDKKRLKDEPLYYSVERSLFFHMNPTHARERFKSIFEHEVNHKIKSVCLNCAGKEVYQDVDYRMDRDIMVAKCRFGPTAKCPDQFEIRASPIVGNIFDEWGRKFKLENDAEKEVQEVVPKTSDFREDFGSW